MRVTLNGTEIPGTRGAMYAREVNEGSATASVSRPLNLTAGDVVKMQASRLFGTSNTQTLANGSRLNLIRIRGPKGDPGAGGVELQNEGGAVAGGPFTTLNFVGSNVVAASSGGGTAVVSVTAPERFFARNDPEQTTTSAAFQTAQSLAFTASGGTYEIQWYSEIKNDSLDSITRCQVLLDGAAIAFADIINGNNLTIEETFGGFDEQVLTAGPHTLEMQYTLLTGAQARIRRVRLRAVKVSN